MNKLLFLLLLLLPLSLIGQVESQFNGTLNVFSGSRIGSTNTFTISGIYSNTTSQYTSANSATGDIVQVQSGSRFYWLHIYSIASNAGGVITCNVRDSSSTLTTFPLGNWNIFRPTVNRRLPLTADGISNAARASAFNTLALRVDQIASSGSSSTNCEQTITKTAHGFRKWTPIFWNGSTYIRPTADSLVPDYIVIDSLTANTFKVASCGTYTTTLSNGLYWFTSANPGYSLTADTTKVPLFQVLNTKLILDPIVGFNLMSGSGSGTGITNGDKGEITVTDDGATWTIDNGVISNAKLATNAVDSTKAANLSPNDLAQTGANTNDVLTWTGSKYAPRPSIGGGSGITALTGDVTASGTGSVAATIANNSVTSAKIASQTLDSTDLKNRGTTLLKLAQSGATNGQVPVYNSTSGNWEAGTVSGGSGSPGGSTTQIQYNNAGSFAGESGIVRSGTGSITLSGKLVSGDTVRAKTLLARGLLTVGDNFTSTLDTITFFGNSITEGYWAFPTVPTARWTTQTSYYYGSFEDNKGISNTRMSGGTNAMEGRTAEIPTYTATRRYLVFDYGVNDANNAVDTTTFKTAFAGVIDAATAKGWPTTRIVIASPTLTGIVSGCVRCRDFVSASKNVALAKSTKYVDMFNGMLTEGGRATIHPDSVHPTVFGHKVAAEVFVNSLNDTDLKGTIRSNQSIIERKLTVRGVSDFAARTNFASDVYFTGEVKSSMNLSAGGLSNIFGEATVSQQKWGLFRSGNSRYGMGISTSGGIFSDHYFSSAATAYRIGTMSSSDGTTYTPLFRVLANGNGDLTGTLSVGGLSVTNATTFSGGVTITGDAVVTQQRLAIFRSGNFRYGIGMGSPDGSNFFTDVYGSSTGSVRLGFISTGDGATYNPVISVWSNGRTYIGTSPIAPTAILHLKAGTATASTASLKIDEGTLLTTAEKGAEEFASGKRYFSPANSTRYEYALTLRGSATLDFGSTAANGESDLTITVTGAADGDVVSLGVPNASATTGVFFAWVSATNTVTVRFHNTSGGSTDPASGTFKVTVTK